MCSVRHRPMPSAPKRTASSASPGVSAFARTRSRRAASAQRISTWKSFERVGCIVGTRPLKTWPVEPSSVITSRSVSSTLPSVARLRSRSIDSAEQPATQHLPMPRATTAACEVMPPSAVRMPCAACMPWMSSGEVSRRTSTTCSPASAAASASSAVNTTRPTAAPGDAGRPCAIGGGAALASSVGWRSWSSDSGFTRSSAVLRSIRPSRAMSTAIFTAAAAVRLPLRVCSIQSRPRWIVNSRSCMSA